MSSLRLATASNVRAFQTLSNALNATDGGWTIEREGLEDEFGRFRVWSGNLGALQQGHSCLDYRLRDSPLLSSSALKFLEELLENLNEAFAIVSGARLPYEQQPRPESIEAEDEDDGFFSEDEDEDEDEPSKPGTELSMRFGEIVDIIDNLYKLGVRIRTPTIRSRSLRAASFKQNDPETGVDILSTYAKYDLQHMEELLSHLRHPHHEGNQDEEDYLVMRLSAAITLRRRQFKYWKRHRDKLGTSTIFEESIRPVQPTMERPGDSQLNDTLGVEPEQPAFLTVIEAPSQKTRKTMLSGTEATHHHQSLDEMIDSKSVTSYAVTVKDIHGKGVNLPPPPKAATGEKDFECPYCYIICPARYGRGRAWRTHLLQDLQPYICTYPVCESSEQLFRSRREWVEHEASHRKAWRCPEHPTAVYKTQAGLEDHLRFKHMDSFPESELTTIVKVGETTTMDVRKRCPICYVSADTEGLGDFQSHVANHLERIATFALPNNTEDDSDGASSVASRGWSGSTGSQDVSKMSLPGDVTDIDQLDQDKETTDTFDEIHHSQSLNEVGITRALLSAESLQHLPDESRNRLEIVASQLNNQSSFDDPQSDGDDHSDHQQDDEQVDETPAEIQEHVEQREAFRVYLMSLAGSVSVRFYKRYGSWTGRAMFEDEVTAAQALENFDYQRFPSVEVYISPSAKNKLKFAASDIPQTKAKKQPPSRQSIVGTQDKEDTRSVSSASIIYEGEEGKSSKARILSVSEIPTLRSLYRTRKLLQRDQSYAPNDVYNRMISFCNHDLTRLKVDAIVNSANRSMKITKSPETLNHAVHRAGGPELTKEARSKGQVKPGQVELTHGHELPSAWVIHASRPQYSGAKGMGKFNILTECYRSALKMAANYEFKTIAFPCLGTGGCGFPPKVAARIALQEVREYLDAQTNCTFERIIFCVNNANEEKIYLDWFAVFFPPTHGDLDVARTVTDTSATRTAPALQVLETRVQVQKLFNDLSTDFSLVIPDFDEDILTALSAIDSTLAGIRGFLLGPKEITTSLSDLDLICSVMRTLCGSVTEMIELAKDTGGFAPKHQSLWADYNAHMKATHKTDLVHILVDCENFVKFLADVLNLNPVALNEMYGMRQRLQDYMTKQVSKDTESDRNRLDEVLYIREFQREAIPHTREIIRLHQISSVARLYQTGALEAKPTLAQPSEIFNHAVCFIRRDITELEVDIMVNSTDVEFLGMGTLDRTVFRQGGLELREQVKKFGKCNEGDVKLTPGYLLPAKHILHIVPPRLYGKHAKGILRKIYREILQTAVLMRATSIAIPSIGTGVLNYPRRDCVSVALEEVKFFLESAEPTSLLEKIIFVVFSSNDEFIYKSLLPVYFPPKEYGTQALPAMKLTAQSTAETAELMGDSPSAEQRPTPRRTLFGTIGEALRTVRFGKQVETSRPINTIEEHNLIRFEMHAKDCAICKDINKLYQEGKDLCDEGYPLARLLLWNMNMLKDQNVYTKPDNNGQCVRLEVSAELFPLSLDLLTVVEKSFRDESRSRPFVSHSVHHAAVTQTQPQEHDSHPSVPAQDKEATKAMPVSTLPARETLRAEVATWSIVAKRWDPISPGECTIDISSGKVDIHDSDYPAANTTLLLSLELTPITIVDRHATNTELILSGAPRMKAKLEGSGDVLFRSRDAAKSEALLTTLRSALSHTPKYPDNSVPVERERVAYPGSQTEPEASYPQWNQRLHDIRNELALAGEQGWAKKPPERVLSPLQMKLQSLSEASDKLRHNSREEEFDQLGTKEPSTLNFPTVQEDDPQASRAKIPRNANSNSLATKILDYLTSDLKSRPGSYIGQHTSNIASALQRSEADVSAAIEELAAEKKVHNTVDESTWVISYTPKDLPPLPHQQRQPETKELPVTGDNEKAMNLLATKILAYMKYVNYAPENKNGQTIREIASALQQPTAEIWPAIRELASRGDIRQTLNAETWIVTSIPQNVSHEAQELVEGDKEGIIVSTDPVTTTIVREVPSFNETPTTPTTETLPSQASAVGLSESYIDLDLRNVNIDDYFSYPSPFGERWTRLDKKLVDAQVLTEAEEDFEDTGDNLIIHRVLRRGEIQLWAERTREIRKWHEQTRETRERRAELTASRSSRRGDARDRDGRRASKETRGDKEGWRDGRGEKDRRQAQLDRVLAGDMKEDELRHFAETEE
ncbi:hypothetical protein BKA66DRAFT_505128 [Pyrenochaeta sp. MPI-SDFR-AT-0127]|nr:hypothetical protein BKA66DRAFT_505128 [Pyrenochaeta sp. MPI-SDFR-AT-0127]